MSVLETPRVRLRPLTTDDAPFLLELLTDADFLRHVGDRGVHSLADAERYVGDGPAAMRARFGFALQALERRTDAQPLGMCGLLRRDSHPDVEIGYALLPRARGQGYAREAAAATLEWAFGILKLPRVVALVAPGNAASIRILEKLGMRCEGTVPFSAAGGESLFYVLERRPP